MDADLSQAQIERNIELLDGRAAGRIAGCRACSLCETQSRPCLELDTA